MLLFRSEEHVHTWCGIWNQEWGSLLTPDQVWGMARLWYGADRRDPDWRRKTAAEAQEIFSGLGLTGHFWEL